MGQWEEKLGAILNNPQAMSQIMSLAQSLGGGQEGSEAQTAPEAVQPPAAAPMETPDAGGGLDPRLMEAGMRALTVWRDPQDPRAALLQALRPFVREERQSKVDKAIRIARLSKAVRAALDGLQQGGGSANV